MPVEKVCRTFTLYVDLNSYARNHPREEINLKAEFFFYLVKKSHREEISNLAIFMKEMFDHITEFSKIENIREPIPRSYRLKDKDKKIDLPQIKKF